MDQRILYRFIRPIIVSSNLPGDPISGKFGGISFKILLDVETKNLYFTYSSCSNKIYFNQKYAKSILDKKFEEKIFELKYNPKINILDNIILGLSESSTEELQKLYKKLIKLLKQNTDKYDNIKKSIKLSYDFYK